MSITCAPQSDVFTVLENFEIARRFRPKLGAFAQEFTAQNGKVSGV